MDKPERILMITTGNIVNKKLLELFEQNFDMIESAFASGSKYSSNFKCQIQLNQRTAP